VQISNVTALGLDSWGRPFTKIERLSIDIDTLNKCSPVAEFIPFHWSSFIVLPLETR
jgi:hypothetical protein